jgi:hypothetical protein
MFGFLDGPGMALICRLSPFEVRPRGVGDESRHGSAEQVVVADSFRRRRLP